MGMNNNQTSCASVSAALHQSCMKYRSHHYPCNYLSRQTYRKDNNRACVQDKGDMVCLLARTKKDEPYPLVFFTYNIISPVSGPLRSGLIYYAEIPVYSLLRRVRSVISQNVPCRCFPAHAIDVMTDDDPSQFRLFQYLV